MASRAVKKPVYDGNTCLLYDYMVAQGLTEEEIAQRMGIDKEQKALWGEEIYNRAPWEPIALWIMRPNSIPMHHIPRLCRTLNAPIESLFIKSRILNGHNFRMGERTTYTRNEGALTDVSSEELIMELRGRGYRVFKEV